jgi:hypothetical protein
LGADRERQRKRRIPAEIRDPGAKTCAHRASTRCQDRHLCKGHALAGAAAPGRLCSPRELRNSCPPRRDEGGCGARVPLFAPRTASVSSADRCRHVSDKQEGGSGRTVLFTRKPNIEDRFLMPRIIGCTEQPRSARHARRQFRSSCGRVEGKIAIGYYHVGGRRNCFTSGNAG